MSYAGKIKAGMAYIEITTDNSKLVRGLVAAQSALKNFSISVQAVGGDLLRLTGMMSIPLAMSMKAFADFDDKMRTIKAISNATNAEYKKLSKSARIMGMESGFSADRVAAGMLELRKIGFSVNEVLPSIRDIMNLVRATGQEVFRLGEITEYVTTSLNAFKLPRESLGDLVDVFTVASNESAADINDIGEAMKIAAPSASILGENIRDTAASLMLLANAGVKGSLAGTSLRKIYQSLAVAANKTSNMTQEQIKEGSRGLEQLREMNIDFVEPHTGNLRPMLDIMQDMAQKVKEMKSGEKINFATDIFDLRGSLGALSMLGNPRELKRLRGLLDNISGVAAKIAQEIDGGIGGVFKKITAQVKEMGIAVGEAVYESFEPYFKVAPKILHFFNNFISENKQLVAQLALVVAGAAAAGVALIALGLSIKLVAHALGGMIIAFKALTAVILLPVNALILITKTITYLGIVSKGISFILHTLVASFKMLQVACYGTTFVIAGLTGIISASSAVLLIHKKSLLAAKIALKIFRIQQALTVVGAVAMKIAFFALQGVIYTLIGACYAIIGVMKLFSIMCQTVAFVGLMLSKAMQAIQMAFNAIKIACMVAWGALLGFVAAIKSAVITIKAFIISGKILSVAIRTVSFVFITIKKACVALFTAIKTGSIIIKTISLVTGAWTAIIHGLSFAITFLKTALISLKTVILGLKMATIAGGIIGVAAAVGIGIVAWKLLCAVCEQVKAGFDIIWSSMKDLGKGFVAAFGNIKKVAGEAFGIVKDALLAGDTAGAAKVALSALYIIWLEGIAPLKKAWAGLKSFLCDSWTIIKSVVLKAANNLWYGLLYGLKAVGNSIADTWNKVWDGIISAFESTIGWLKKKWIQFKGFFDSDVNIDAEIAKVDQEIAENKTERAKRTNASVAGRQAELDKLNGEWDASNQKIDDKMVADIAASAREYNDALGKASSDLEAARKSYEDAKKFAAMWKTMQAAVKDLQRVFDESGEDYRMNRAHKDTEAQKERAKVDEVAKTDPSKAQDMMREIIAREKEKARVAKEEFEKALKEAQTDRVIDPQEKAKLEGLSAVYGRASELEAQYKQMLQSGADGTSNAMLSRMKVMGGWNMGELLSNMMGSSMDRTAVAAEESVRQAKESNRWLRKVATSDGIMLG